MKKMRKMLAVVLAVMIAATMGIATTSLAFAADGDDTITLSVKTQTQADQNSTPETYTAYKVFSVVKASGATGNNSDSTLGAGSAEGYSYVIKSTDPFYSKIVTGGILNDYITLSDIVGSTDKAVTIKEGKNTEAAAKEMAAILKNNLGNITGTSLTASSGNGPVSAEVAPGYYMIDSSLGSNLVLATTDIQITEKNDYPSISKDADKSNMSIGDTITYTVEVVVPASVDTTKNITVTDTLDDVLKYTANTATATVKDASPAQSVSLTESTITANATDKTNSWTWTFSASGLAGKTVVITYTAKLLDTAAADKEYVNKAFLEYSNYKTPEVDKKVKTFDFDLNKTDGSATITGAEFELRTGSADGTAIKFTKSGSVYTKVDGEVADEGNAKIEAGKVTIKGLAAGSYYLVETKAPEGYNPLQGALTVTINDEGTVSVTKAKDADNATVSGTEVTVVNNQGTELPSTGGIGTTIFYILGALLIVGCGIILIARRRMSANN